MADNASTTDLFYKSFIGFWRQRGVILTSSSIVAPGRHGDSARMRLPKMPLGDTQDGSEFVRLWHL
jgi:hypothetical protein